MLSVAEAQELVLQRVRPLPPQIAPLGPQALGLVLAEDVQSDLDMPPWDKAMMDGYAVRSEDLVQGPAVLAVVEEIMAGQMPHKVLGSGQAARIMTGAPIPGGADAVVMVERTRSLEDGHVRIEDTPKPRQHILSRGREMQRGETVLHAGTRLRPQEFGVLAAVGRSAVKVHPAPHVAILPTGDEIVDIDTVPGPGQIRNSNGNMLLAQVCRAGAMPRPLGIARDQVEHLRALVSEGLKADVLILSGGVSAGERDLVPGVLGDLGVEAVFHKVAMKPGKPVFFGVGGGTQSSGTLVFGLPGNPVSSLVCFELFVRPALRRLQGHADPGPFFVQARLTDDLAHRSDRPTYHPCLLLPKGEGWVIKPVPWFGSPDLRGLLQSDAFVLFPPGEHKFKAGQSFPVLRVE
jgi:molybdopterin molybdotransferase